MDVLELPLKYPHLFPLGSPRRHGVLLYGPPGKIIQCGCHYYIIKVGFIS